MRIVASLLTCLDLTACAGMPAPPSSEDLFRDASFAAPRDHIDAADVFAMSDAMQRYARTEIAARARQLGRQQALVDALYHRQQLKLEYDAAMTRNAAQAFEARSGNCLSLVIMTAAFAKELGLQIEYRSAFLEETWSRSGDMLFRSGHVNVTLGPRLVDFHHSVDSRNVTIDFLAPDDVRGVRTRGIDERTVVAMYMNNRAAEALARNRIDDAYAWAREAIRQDPSFIAAYSTLGVVYVRHGDAAPSELAFRRVLALEPVNTRAASN